MVSVHGGAPWSKSRALLGSIANIERGRVNELVNPEPDRPLSPHWRASSLRYSIYFFVGYNLCVFLVLYVAKKHNSHPKQI